MELLLDIMHFNPYWLAGAVAALLVTTWAQWYFLTTPPRPAFDVVYIRAAGITAMLALASQGALQAAATAPAVPPAWYVPAWNGFCAVGMWWMLTRFGQKKRQELQSREVIFGGVDVPVQLATLPDTPDVLAARAAAPLDPIHNPGEQRITADPGSFNVPKP